MADNLPKDLSAKLDETLNAVRSLTTEAIKKSEETAIKVEDGVAKLEAVNKVLGDLKKAPALDLLAIKNNVLTKYNVNIQTDDPVFAVVTAAAEAAEQVGLRHIAVFTAVLEGYRKDLERSAKAAAERGEKTATETVNNGAEYLKNHVLNEIKTSTDDAIALFRSEVTEGVTLIRDSVGSTSRATQSAWIGAVIAVGTGCLVLGAILTHLIH